MKHTLKLLLTMVVSVAAATAVLAQAEESDPEVEQVRTELAKMMPGAVDANITRAPAAGVFQVEVQGNYYYAYVDGDHILFGDLLNTKDKVNIGQEQKANRISDTIAGVSTEKMIVYGPEDAKRHITVFTDIDCGYCRKLHQEVPQLTDAGVQVRYLAFPRAGVGSASHKKYVSVWCNADQQAALTDAKAGKSVPAASCENPVAETYELGQKVGVEGTPTIIFDDGTLTPGYIPYDRLLKRMGLGG